MMMDETRKRQLITGIVIGAVVVGGVILLRRTPREKWGETFGNIAKDALGVVKSRYGNNEVVRMAETAINRALEA